jgi:hypothetical protein
MKHVRSLVAAAALVLLAVIWLVSSEARLTVALLVLLVAPGYLLERALLGRAALPLLARAALWLGLSVSCVAVLYQWAAALGVSLVPGALLGLAVLSLLGALVVWLRQTQPAPAGSRRREWVWPAVLAALLVLTLWTRFAHVRELVAPAWVDSLHHALLIRVAVERGQAPYALAPFLPLERLTYHSGFHSFVAAVLAVCGGEFDMGGTALCETPLRLPEAMLPIGQILNALVALAWASAAAFLWRGRVAAPVAALVVGLASIMPAYYVSWGRYTLVAGMLLLPAAIVAAQLVLGGTIHEAHEEHEEHEGKKDHVLLDGRPPWKRTFLRVLRVLRGSGAVVAAALLLAGLSLVHFVALCLALLWCAALAVSSRLPFRLVVLRGALMGALALAITLPWYAMLVPQVRPGAGAAAMYVAGEQGYNAMPVALLWAGSNQLLTALAGCGALLAVWCRWRTAARIVLWWALVVLAANPVLLGLPYLSFFTNEFVAITLFVPLALLIAGGAAALEMRVPARVWRVAPLLLLGLGVWLAAQFQTVVRPDTVLASAADLRAIAWAAQATPADARFVVNTAPWLYDVNRGADGGWWLLPLAGRQVSTPPVVFNYGPPAYVQRVTEETSWLRSGAGADPLVLADFMRQHGYSHVFATGRGSSVDPERLRGAVDFVELHRDEDVSIFALRR